MDQTQLLDLAPTWLASMVLGVAESRQLNPLFRTCSKLQQLIFQQPAIQPGLGVNAAGIWRLGAHLHARALAMAEAAEAKLILDLEVTCANGQALDQLLSSAAALIPPAQQPQKPSVMRQLTCIKVVTISSWNGAPLHCILPDALVHHCPNLQVLRLEDVSIDPQYRSPQLACTSLHKLSLRRIDDIGAAGFKQHLLHLPSLTALQLSETGSAADYKEGGVFWAAIARYSSQLRVLCCKFMDDVLTTLPWPPTTHLPLLQELELAVDLEGDDNVQQLFTSAPNVKCVKLRSITGLKRISQVPCSWQELRLRDVYVAELAWLSLSTCTRLVCECKLYLRKGDADEQAAQKQITAAVAALQMTGGLHFGNRVGITLYADEVERLTAAAPLLEHLDKFAWGSIHKPGTEEHAPWSDCRPLLAVLGQHLRCELFCLRWEGWADSPGAAAQLPELLPHVKEFFCNFPSPPEAELVQMVRTASRQFTLKIYLFNYGFVEQLQQVMKEAGHQLVTIQDSQPL